MALVCITLRIMLCYRMLGHHDILVTHLSWTFNRIAPCLYSGVLSNGCIEWGQHMQNSVMSAKRRKICSCFFSQKHSNVAVSSILNRQEYLLLNFILYLFKTWWCDWVIKMSNLMLEQIWWHSTLLYIAGVTFSYIYGFLSHSLCSRLCVCRQLLGLVDAFGVASC